MTRRRRLGLGCLLVLLLFLGAFGFSARRLLFPRRLAVVSIRTERSYQDPALMARAWEAPVARAYRPGFFSQPNGSICGPTSLANVRRSQGEAGASLDAVLSGSGLCPLDVCWGGLSLDALAGLHRRRGARVTVLRPMDLQGLRRELSHVDDPARRYVVNFDRGPLFGTEGGHHSPIGAFLADRDLVFVLDVNARYGPWLVATPRLLTAMNSVDRSTGRPRGLLRIE